MAPGDIVVRPGFVIPETEIEELASRSSGPGGQHVNKSSTRVTLRWNVQASPTPSERQRGRLLERLGSRLTRDAVLVVHADRHRSRTRNRELARERIAELVTAALEVQRPRRPTRPSLASKKRRISSKRHRSGVKQQRGTVSRDQD